MNFKKWLTAVCSAAVLTSASMAAVAAQTVETQVKDSAAVKSEKPDYSFLNGKIGTTISTMFGEEAFKGLVNKYRGTNIEKIIYSDSNASALAMLKSGRANFIITADITADYVTQRNPEFKSFNCIDSRDFVMVLRNSDAGLKDALDSAIAKLKESGKTDELYKKWVKELPVGEEPSMNKIEKVSDTAEVIYVGVSGDAPPLDYMAADGKPAGYNLALLAEISKIIGKNIEIVSIDSKARYAALESKKIDVFFWQVIPAEKEMLENMKPIEDRSVFNKKFAVTKPYCTVKTAFLLKK